MDGDAGAFGRDGAADAETDAEEILGAESVDNILYAIVTGRAEEGVVFIFPGGRSTSSWITMRAVGGSL